MKDQTDLEKAIKWTRAHIDIESPCREYTVQLLLAAERSIELEQQAVAFAGDAGKWAAECDNLEQRLKEVEGIAEKQMTLLTGAARPSVEMAEELSTLRAENELLKSDNIKQVELLDALQVATNGLEALRTEYRKALEALNESKVTILDLVRYFDTLDTTRAALLHNMEIIEAVLSSPSAIAAMKGES